MRFSLLTLSAVATLMSEAATCAEARPRRYVVAHGQPRVIVVTGRSFLDSGPQVPVGSLQNYVLMSTSMRSTIISGYRPDAFGGDVLPNRFNNPGRPQPLLTFSSPGY